MVRPALACLALAASACFSDQGFDPTGGGATRPDLSTSSDASTTAAPTTAAPTGTTAEPTTSGPDTTGPGTTGPDTTGPDTTGPAACEAPQCEPGDVLVGEPCDICGETQQVCGNDCTWGPAQCVVGDTCGYWVFEGNIGWRVERPPASGHAPQGPVGAAFDLFDGRVVAIAGASYHVLSAAGTWTASGQVAALFPDLEGPVLQAYTIPENESTSAVTLVDGPKARIYYVTGEPLKAELLKTSECCSAWVTIQPPSLAAVRDLFVDLENAQGWADVDPVNQCGAEPPVPSAYGAWLTPDAVYVQDGICNEIVDAVPLAQFAPFAAPNAPPGDRVGGATLLFPRFYVFPGE